ncbi:hypothetical protein CKO28_25315 [Rhodovibrio sodomensis]|uniref:Urease accessory protein UreD n=1 Tax=Rhodovibrio sodomensis TaxID=1088 RepID=A0ABS1DM57_9PROT|nr:hypothetical protein [Rhodovibrio sodomensis]MBK1671324.1 hypothetical protein [Rhodovibrio sodomensis]
MRRVKDTNHRRALDSAQATDLRKGLQMDLSAQTGTTRLSVPGIGLIEFRTRTHGVSGRGRLHEGVGPSGVLTIQAGQRNGADDPGTIEYRGSRKTTVCLGVGMDVLDSSPGRWQLRVREREFRFAIARMDLRRDAVLTVQTPPCGPSLRLDDIKLEMFVPEPGDLNGSFVFAPRAAARFRDHRLRLRVYDTQSGVELVRQVVKASLIQGDVTDCASFLTDPLFPGLRASLEVLAPRGERCVGRIDQLKGRYVKGDSLKWRS